MAESSANLSPAAAAASSSSSSSPAPAQETKSPSSRRWAFGILQDELTDEVPGSVLLLSKVHKNNAPLGLDHLPRQPSSSSLPASPYPQSEAMFRPPSLLNTKPADTSKKRTKDGKIILEPQPEDTANDPLNWSPLRRDLALISLGIYCMLGGGMTPVLAAGFNNVASDYGVSVPQVALTTGLYMLGLGVGSVIFSPTAIILGKRPIYLATSVMFLLTAVWCALSPNYTSLVVARVFQGIAVSPVECLPSATIAEIFFLHERAYRLGIYTLLLLGGKNLVPLVSAAIIERLGWRWVFWVVAIVVGFCGVLLFVFVPETFWDRSPLPHNSGLKRSSSSNLHRNLTQQSHATRPEEESQETTAAVASDRHRSISGALARRRENKRARFASEDAIDVEKQADTAHPPDSTDSHSAHPLDSSDTGVLQKAENKVDVTYPTDTNTLEQTDSHALEQQPQKRESEQTTPSTDSQDKISVDETQSRKETDRQDIHPIDAIQSISPEPTPRQSTATTSLQNTESERPRRKTAFKAYTEYYRSAPVKSYLQTLKPWDGRLGHDNWFKIAARPFVLFAYPAILWSAAVYMLSVGWLIVLSESVSEVYKSRDTYNFTSLQTGLVYISPFIGGVLGTAVAGKVSDTVVRAMSKRNGGVYEPEFRLVMALPVAVTTTAGLMGFGWSVEERDAWIVPTVFFGVISFGCCVGSTTAITFAVDSYRQYAGEALVTLNWSKNVFHGLVFSLFFNHWLESDGSRSVFLAIGGIQLAVMLFTVPMYVFGKRARMWTVRKRMMERF